MPRDVVGAKEMMFGGEACCSTFVLISESRNGGKTGKQAVVLVIYWRHKVKLFLIIIRHVRDINRVPMGP